MRKHRGGLWIGLRIGRVLCEIGADTAAVRMNGASIRGEIRDECARWVGVFQKEIDYHAGVTYIIGKNFCTDRRAVEERKRKRETEGVFRAALLPGDSREKARRTDHMPWQL